MPLIILLLAGKCEMRGKEKRARKLYCQPTVWNLKAINGRFKSNQSIILLFIISGKITIKLFPKLLTTISELWTREKGIANWVRMKLWHKINWFRLSGMRKGRCVCVAYPKIMQNGKISNNTDADIGRCFSSRVIASEANEKARLSNVNWNV